MHLASRVHMHTQEYLRARANMKTRRRRCTCNWKWHRPSHACTHAHNHTRVRRPRNSEARTYRKSTSARARGFPHNGRCRNHACLHARMHARTHSSAFVTDFVAHAVLVHMNAYACVPKRVCNRFSCVNVLMHNYTSMHIQPRL